MKWIKITAANFIDLQIGDKLTKENSVELANVMNEEPVAEDEAATTSVYMIKDASTAPEKTVKLECTGKDNGFLEVTDDELIEAWWRLVK